ncbi:MAG: hypothetical protein PHS41_06125 [Victivallaceae bacterium]|nr:hypothetical protein [Victivallaceae bacterium]
MQSEIQRDRASFRDPAGYVFRRGDGVFRRILSAGAADWQCFLDSGLADELDGRGDLVRWRTLPAPDDREGGIVLELEELDFLSMPCEWCFSQLKDAALLTLDLQLRALARGMSLKDASAFNVAWRGGRSVFLDHGSFERYREDEPWRAYGQFVRHFLAPLLLACKDVRFLRTLSTRLDGVELDFAGKNLPLRSWLDLHAIGHIHLHAGMEKKHSNSPLGKVPVAPPRLPKARLAAMLTDLKQYIARLSPPHAASEWGDYYCEGKNNYSEESFSFKSTLVDSVVSRLSPRRCVDFGANSGYFSKIAARHSAVTIAADMDCNALEALYLSVRGDESMRLYPVRQDLDNPTPGCGVFNEERPGFLARTKSQLGLFLAITHHLRIGSNWPMQSIVRLVHDQCENAVVEFVPKNDSQVQKLLRTRPDLCLDWNLPDYCAAFSAAFEHCEVIPIPGSERFILILEKTKK